MDYKAVNTKLLAMGSRLFKYSDYSMLSQLGSVEEVGLRLKEFSAYKPALESIPNHELRRTNIEHKIIFSLSHDYEKLYKFLCDSESRLFLESIFLKTDIYILKILLCSIYDSKEIVYSIPEITALVHKHFKIDVGKLKNAKTVPDFIDYLQGTIFYKPLHDIYAPERLLYELEVQLDLLYYMQLWDLLEAGHSKRNTKVLREILGLETDLRNITWIYRLKAYYDIPHTNLYSHLIPYYHQLERSHIVRMVECKSLDALKLEIEKTPYAEAFRNVEKPERVFDVEMLKQYSLMQQKFPNSLASTLAYLFQKDLEISNITSLIECVRYGLKEKDTLNYLTITRGTEVS